MKRTTKAKLLEQRSREGVRVKLVESKRPAEPRKVPASDPPSSDQSAPAKSQVIEVQIVGAEEIRSLVNAGQEDRAALVAALVEVQKARDKRLPWRFEIIDRDDFGNIKVIEARPTR